MAFYRDSKVLCDVMTDLFTRTATSPAAIQAMQKHRLVLRLEMHEPTFTLTVDGKASAPQFTCGPSPIRPDLVLRMPADVLHNVWMGKIRLRDAYFNGQIQVEGSIFKALTLADLFRQVEALYPGILRDRGLL